VRRQRLTSDLEQLYRSEYRRFLRVSLAIVGDEAAAHDVVQEAFARALRSAHTYRADGALAAWVWSILVNTARAASRGRELPAEMGDRDEAGPVDEDDGDVRDWISSLPERQRLAIFLRYYADLGPGRSRRCSASRRARFRQPSALRTRRSGDRSRRCDHDRR